MRNGGHEYVGVVPPHEEPSGHRAGQATAFDAIGDRYDEAFPHKEGQIAAGGWLTASLPAGSRVLDAGCGTGVPTVRQLSAAGLLVTGVELSPGMLALARRNVPDAEYLSADLTRLLADGLLAPGSFDAVTAFFTLLMLPRREIPGALGMLRELLVPGGLLALGMVEADVDDVPIPFLGHIVRVSGYLREDLHHLVTDAGFEVVKEESYGYAPASTDVPPEEQIFLYCRRA